MLTDFSFRQMIYPKHGPAEVFQWRTHRCPPLKPDEVLIEVKFIGINFADIVARRGYYHWADKPPFCPGFEVSGKVIDKGKNVALPIGTPVLAVTRFGGYAEAIVVSQERVRRLPKGMSLEEGAAIPVVYITAYHSLMEVLRIREGEDILIQAVAGGVGSAALQIAKHVGLTVYGTASTDKKLKFAKSLGLDHAINYSRVDFEKEMKRLTSGRGVKFLLDSLGGYALRKGIRSLRPMGHAVTIGAAGIVPPQGVSFNSIKEWGRIASDLAKGAVYHPIYLIAQNKGISGVQVLLLWDEIDHLSRIIDQLLKWYRAGVIKANIHKIFPLEEVADAHRFVEARKTQGKVLLATSGAKN